MNERIKKIRKELDLTQQEFADMVGIPRDSIGGYETGRRNPSEAALSLICTKCHVNEEWLRTGQGEMFIKQTRDEQIAAFIGSIQMDADDSFKKRLISMLSALNEDEWEMLERMAIKLYEEKD